MLLPEQVQIQTIDYCNRKCQWCPNSEITKSAGTLMDRVVFEKILSDLTAVNYMGKFHLYLMGEPLCDPRMVDLIGRVRELFPTNTIFISTNGDNLKGYTDITRLFGAGLSVLGISYYDHKNDFLKNYRDDRIIHATLKDLRPSFYNRAGLVKVSPFEPLKKCGWLWSKAYINHRGDVILCCSDYYYQAIMGNVMEQDFATIFNNEKYTEYRKAHEAGNGKDMNLCRDCNRIYHR